ncbi:hypothetical protein OHB24_09770 [Kribbella sp. NBC_00482]|uniref:hypothetical protein n=1 Tax=Kribbella sp. NBC_00482 TaxID=2975968 RepID=UPI002E16D93C
MPSSKITPIQTVRLMHRKNIFGRYTGWNRVAWDYVGYVHHVRRPQDGDSVYRWVGDCAVCSNPPTYRVYSVAATKRVLKFWNTTGGAILLLGLGAIPFGIWGPVDRDGIWIGAGVGAVLLGLMLLGLADDYFGFIGPGVSSSGHPVHRLILPDKTEV